MTRASKTVFISYRRNTSKYMALAVYQNLIHNGYDVFMDIENINSGEFEKIIVNEIARRTHFVLILAPKSLDRCLEPNDWLRREIETALSFERNIIPLLFDDFRFEDNVNYLADTLSDITKYNALSVPFSYFGEAMQKLSNRFLKRPKHSIAGFDTGVYSASEIYGDETQIEASSIRAKKHMMQGNLHFNHGEYDEAIMCYTKAIQEQPKDSVQAFYNRGMTYYEMGDWSNAFQDLSTVIANDPKSHKGYERRAKILYAQGELTAAISDYTSAIQLEPTRINYYLNRAYIYWKLGQYTEAKQDYTNAIEINPHDSFAFLGRGETNYELGQFEAAYNDFEKAHALKPQLNSIEAELAIVHYTLGRVDKGRTIWEQLVNNNKNYENLNWISEEFGWGPTLIQKAQELIDSL